MKHDPKTMAIPVDVRQEGTRTYFSAEVGEDTLEFYDNGLDAQTYESSVEKNIRIMRVHIRYHQGFPTYMSHEWCYQWVKRGPDGKPIPCDPPKE
jgi:hypothetical protein